MSRWVEWARAAGLVWCLGSALVGTAGAQSAETARPEVVTSGSETQETVIPGAETPGRAALTQDAAAGSAGTPAQLQVSYERTWPEQKVPYFRITVRADGTGSYSTVRPTEGASAPTAGSGADAASPAAPALQPLRVSERNRAKILAVVPVVRSAKGCEGGNRHTAQTGHKAFSVQGDGPAAQCAFNFSDDRRLEDAVSILNGMALTVEEGDRLGYLLRFDRLGLDAALGSLLDDVQAGRAEEVENIAPLLRKLQADDALMTRVRERATKLLEMGGVVP